MLAIAIVPGKRVYESILKIWNVIDKNNGIRFISSNSGLPHITLIAELDESKKEEIINSIKSSILSTKPFKICSRGFGAFLIETPLIYLRWKDSKKLNSLRSNILKDLKKNKLVDTNLIENYDWIPKTTICYKDIFYENNLINVISAIKSIMIEDIDEQVYRLILIRYLEGEKEKVVEEFSLK